LRSGSSDCLLCHRKRDTPVCVQEGIAMTPDWSLAIYVLGKNLLIFAIGLIAARIVFRR
jgi:hypothetical protein